MYCSECGKPASGKFCSNCGTPLMSVATAVSVAAPVAPAATMPSVPPAPHLPISAALAVTPVVNIPVASALVANAPTVNPVVVNWDQEWRYDELMKVADVRRMIERHAGMARSVISGEQFTKFADKILQNPIPSDKLAAFAQPIFGSFGIKTGKDRTVVVDAPIGRAMVRVLCSLARHGQSLRGVQQGPDGCIFAAVLPSDPMSLEGDVSVTVRRRDAGASNVTAAMKITGQLYDWGKCRRALDAFLADMQIDPA
jgi:hypothetical protein